ncbi:MAG: hypothetical protein U1E73_13185 [Planctomycetota bacterium]
MRAPCLLVLALLVAAVRTQEVAELVAKLAAAATLDEAMVGEDGARTDTYRIYEQLRGRARVAELRALLVHDSRIVRGYAARALAEIGADVDWRALVTAHLADTTTVRTRGGCSVQDEPFGDWLFALGEQRQLLAGEALLDVAEQLVREKSPLYARERCLRQLRFRDGMLHEIRALARAGDGPALIALARFGLAGDVPLVVERLHAERPFADNCAFLAAALLRDARILDALAELEPRAREHIAADIPERLRFWLAAIVAQDSAGAAALLLRVARWPLADAAKQKGLRETLRGALAPVAAREVFAEVRALLAK